MRLEDLLFADQPGELLHRQRWMDLIVDVAAGRFADQDAGHRLNVRSFEQDQIIIGTQQRIAGKDLSAGIDHPGHGPMVSLGQPLERAASTCLGRRTKRHVDGHG